jgi:uncharacterized protein YcgI (DUF1989 family)
MPRIQIPAREARAVRLPAGATFRVIDVEGRQAGDLWAFAADGEYHDAPHTRVETGRLFPAIGEQFWSNRRCPILTLLEDRSPGLHDMLMAACDPERFVRLGHVGHHASCQENLLGCLAAEGVEAPLVPQPINLFMNIPIRPDGTLEQGAAQSAPGDYVALRAELDCLVVVSACPQDIVQTNALEPTPLAIEVD